MREQPDRADEHRRQSDKHRGTWARTGSHAVTGADTGASSGAITGTWSCARTAWSGARANADTATGASVDVRWLDQSGALVRRADTT